MSQSFYYEGKWMSAEQMRKAIAEKNNVSVTADVNVTFITDEQKAEAEAKKAEEKAKKEAEKAAKKAAEEAKKSNK